MKIEPWLKQGVTKEAGMCQGAGLMPNCSPTLRTIRNHPPTLQNGLSNIREYFNNMYHLRFLTQLTEGETSISLEKRYPLRF